MSLISFVCLVTMVMCVATAHDEPAAGPSVLFTGTTPCSNIIRPLHNIAKEPDCQLNDCHCIMVEWKLILYSDAVSGKPATYKLTGINRFSVKETNMYSEPGTKSERSGNWRITKGTKTNPDAVVYELNADSPGITVRFIRLSDNLLHILDADDRLLVGNEFFSYTLNRVASKN
jgi:hypothetical protein